MKPRTLADFRAYQKDARARRRKRGIKADELGFARRSDVREKLWGVFATFIKLRDRRAYGNRCRIGQACRGQGLIECAYHIVPQRRGDAIRYDEEAVVGACSACNCGERWHRSAYRDVHIRVFGLELVERLEAKARLTVKLSTAELVDMIARFSAKAEGVLK